MIPPTPAPPIAPMLFRFRRPPSLVGAACVLAGLAAAPNSPLRAQGGPPVELDHWSYEFLEALDAAGAADAWMAFVRPVSRGAVRAELRRIVDYDLADASVVEAWARRFDADHPLRAGSRGEPAGRRLEVRAAAGWVEGDALVNPGAGAFGAVEVAGRILPRLTGWLSLDSGRRERVHRAVNGGFSLRVGDFSLMATRQRIKTAGLASTSSQLGGEVPLDAFYAVSERPSGTGWLEWLTGPTVWQFSLAPRPELGESDGGWVGSGGVVTRPHPRLRFGVTRSARFGGTGLPGLSPSRLLNTVFLRQNDPFFWDDQKMEVFLRVRWGLFGQPLATYVVLGQEDTPLWKDPGLVAGGTLPFLLRAGLLSFRYEYTAYGQRARWCPGCEFQTGVQTHRVQGPWNRHDGLGPHQIEGIPLGDPLGGYGAGHTIAARFWSAGGAFRGRAWTFFQVRDDERNLLRARWPGKRRGGAAEVSWHFRPGFSATLGSMLTDGPLFDREGAVWFSVDGVVGW